MSSDARLAELSDRQHRVVARRQLLAAGVPPDVIDRRIRARRLFVVHRGVNAVGTPELEWHGRVLAAVLACGPRAVAGHRTAGELLGMRDGGRVALDVIVPRTRHGLPGMVIHRARDLRVEDVTRVRAIPVTTVARTLLDRAAAATRDELRREINQARTRGVLDEAALEAQLARHGGYAGAAELRGSCCSSAIARNPSSRTSSWRGCGPPASPSRRSTTPSWRRAGAFARTSGGPVRASRSKSTAGIPRRSGGGLRPRPRPAPRRLGRPALHLVPGAVRHREGGAGHPARRRRALPERPMTVCAAGGRVRLRQTAV